MYEISNNYKKYIENNTSLLPQNKIVVDGVEYTGKVIKTAPKISHTNEKFIGGFPTKTCSFDIYDFDNSIDFENKEIYVYKGFLINNEIEYVPQGIFIPTADKITTDISTKTVSFKNIQDKTQFFDDKYKSNLDWSSNHTGLEIVLDICNSLKIHLETYKFNWSTYEFKRPNFVENISYREVISRLAEIGGSIAFISRNGGLVIKGQTLTDNTIERKRYSKLTKENQFGPINTIILGKDGIDDDIFYPSSINEEKKEWKILDNPFVDLYREEMIEEVSKYIIGLSVIPFTLTDFVDGFFLDLNDVITIKDKYNNFFTGVILNYENTSRIKTKIGTSIQEGKQTNYNLAGSQKQALKDVKFEVDHNEQRITGLVEEIDENTDKISELEIDIDEIKQQISNISDLTVTGETTEAKVFLYDVGEGYLFHLTIHPYMENIVGLYPHNDIHPGDDTFMSEGSGNTDIALTFPSNNIFPGNKTFSRLNAGVLKITNITTGEVVTEYELPTNLYYMNENVYDTLDYNYGEDKCIVTKNVEFIDGSPRKLETPIIEKYDFPIIETQDADYKVELVDYDKAYLLVKMLNDNDYTDVFATKVELKSSITQTEDKIELEVQNLTEHIDGSILDLDSKFTQTAEDITAEVNKKIGEDEAKSLIKVTADEINQEVSKKVGNNEIISKINQSAERIQINANKISLEGKNIALTSDNISISSNNFNVDKNGNLSCNNSTMSNATITGGNIDLTSSQTNSRLKMVDVDNSSCYWEMAARRWQWYGLANGYIGFTNITKTPYISLSDTDNNETQVASSFIRTPIVNQTSLASQKKNFEKFDNAIQVINDIDLYKYNLKNEDDNHKKHIGFVIGDGFKYSREITAIDENGKEIGVDLYSMISLCLQAIKEQQTIINNLCKRIEVLENEKSNIKNNL